jgi:hypothetical protein
MERTTSKRSESSSAVGVEALFHRYQGTNATATTPIRRSPPSSHLSPSTSPMLSCDTMLSSTTTPMAPPPRMLSGCFLGPAITPA